MFEGGFGVDGVEVDEPGLEQRPRHLFQRLVHPPVQFDLVVQHSQDVRDVPLFGEGREGDLNFLRKPRELKSSYARMLNLMPFHFPNLIKMLEKPI